MFVHFVIKHTKHMHHIIFPSVTGLPLPYFFTLFQIWNVGKVRVIYKNQLETTIFYRSRRSAQHVSGHLLPIFRSIRLRFLQHIVCCYCGRQGFGEWQHGTTCTVRRMFLQYTQWHVATPRTPALHKNRILYAVKISVLRSWIWAKDGPKHVDLNL